MPVAKVRPTIWELSFKNTESPLANPVNVNESIVALVILSVLDSPVSSRLDKSGASGAADACVSIRSASASEIAELLPAPSRAVTSILYDQ